MANRPAVTRTVPALRQALLALRKGSRRVALVPTMGALHRGHLALVAEARRRAGRVVVSIFVNPAQFAPTEDFASYPRGFDADLKALAAAKTDLVWAPTEAAMYPEGFATNFSRWARPKPGWKRSSVRISSAASHRGGQAVHAMRAGFRAVRRKGLPAAAGHHPDGQGSRPAGRGDRDQPGARK